MVRSDDPALAPSPPTVPTVVVAVALLSARLIDAQAPPGTSTLLRASLPIAILLLLAAPLAIEAWQSRRARTGAWLAARRGALAAIATLLVLTALCVGVRESMAESRLFTRPQAPWPFEPLAGAAALLLAAQVLPFPATAGARLVEHALRRERPQLVAARLTGRIGGALLGGAALLFALLPGGGSDFASLTIAALYGVAAVIELRAAFRKALAREWALQHDGAWQLPGVRPLSPAQFTPFSPLAATAYDALAGVRKKQKKPAASAASSNTTEPA
ncbi:MAG: hypothetical protein EXS13_00625 [Planctomycetes bacterium]|nr:hypothetical protein [Planctomycetota bacterium]